MAVMAHTQKQESTKTGNWDKNTPFHGKLPSTDFQQDTTSY